MQKEFEYFYEKIVNATIDIEDIGNCSIEVHNDNGAFYYLVVKTDLGQTEIFEYGPICPDIDILPKTVNCIYKRIDYKESQIIKTIQTFLTDPYKQITSAIEIEPEEAYNNCINIIDYMRKKEILY